MQAWPPNNNILVKGRLSQACLVHCITRFISVSHVPATGGTQSMPGQSTGESD